VRFSNGVRTVPRFLLIHFAFALTVIGAPMAAQSSLATEDTSVVAGYRDGRIEAGKRRVGFRGVAGLVGGVAAGFAAPIALFVGSGPGVGIFGAGSGGVLAAAEMGRNVPSDSLTARSARRGKLYAIAFDRGYSDRLKSRRRTAAYTGGGIGAVAGIVLLFMALQGYD
jgi:hypothetical protein